MSTLRFCLLIWLFAALGIAPASLYAQRPRITGDMLRKACVTPVSVHTWRINQAALKKLNGLMRPAPHIQAAQAGLPAHAKRQVFQVKRSPTSHSTASAFALEINGRVWGVTAAHVMNNIRLSPHMVVENEYGKQLIAPIAYQYMGNPRGNDVAIFEIPKELLPYVDVLHPADKIPAAQTVTQSPCFIKGNPVYLPSEDILFSGPHRILLRDQAHRDMTGYCGSPVLVDGKVVGAHVGSFSLQDLKTIAWSDLLTDHNIQPKSTLHIASPIQRVEELALEFEMLSSRERVGTQLKVLGHPVTILSPQHFIHSIQLLRDGVVKKTIYSNPFMDFEKLETFFELQENDVLRVTILQPKNAVQRTYLHQYDVNVSTGQVFHRAF